MTPMVSVLKPAPLPPGACRGISMSTIRTSLTVAVGLVALFLLGNAALWLTLPEAAAGALKMPLLEGSALSSQMDVGAFFLGAGSFTAAGLVLRRREWFIAAAVLLLGAAFYRTMAFLFHGAAFLPDMILAEIVMGALLIAASRMLSAPRT